MSMFYRTPRRWLNVDGSIPAQSANAAPSGSTRRRSRLSRFRLAVAGALVACLLIPATSLAGNWTWWGYRTNSWETWALASQTPSLYNTHIPVIGKYFSWGVYALGWSWHWNAQNARWFGECTGITWSASPIIVGCSSS